MAHCCPMWHRERGRGYNSAVPPDDHVPARPTDRHITQAKAQADTNKGKGSVRLATPSCGTFNSTFRNRR